MAQIQPLRPYTLFTNKNGVLTTEAYNFLYNLYLRVGGSLDSLNAVTLADHTWEEPAPIGSVTPNTGRFTTLTTTGATTFSPPNANVDVSPTGTGTFTVNPAVTGTINNMSIGAASASTGVFTTVNKITFTQPATSATFTLVNGKTFTVSNTMTLTATDGSTLAIGAGGTLGTAAYTAASTYALVAGSSSQAFATSTLTASNIITATRTSSGATIDVMDLKNAGVGANTKASLSFYAAGTKYASLVGGFGAAVPEFTVEISAVQQLRVATAGVAINAGFGCNTKAAQTPFTLGAAATDLASVIVLSNNLRTMAINNGTGQT